MPPETDLSTRLSGLLLDLVSIPSVTGDEGAIARAVEALLAPLPFQVTRVGNALAARGPVSGRPLVTLVGHLDTVPPAPVDLDVRVEGTRLYGRGASDMKGGLAVMLALAQDLAPSPYDLGLVFYDREEGPDAENGLEPLLAAVPWVRGSVLGFCLEPSENDVQQGCMGSMHARVTFEGRAAHSARPWQGENAIHKAARVLGVLASLAPRDVEVGGLTFREVMVATVAQGGRTRNVVPDRFEIIVNHRFAPGVSLDEAERRIRHLVGADARVDIVDRSPAGPVVQGNPHLDRFLALTGAGVAPKQAWTDVARLAAWGIPAVNFGPGLPAQCHQAGEYTEIPQLVEGYRRLHRFLFEG